MRSVWEVLVFAVISRGSRFQLGVLPLWPALVWPEPRAAHCYPEGQLPRMLWRVLSPLDTELLIRLQLGPS